MSPRLEPRRRINHTYITIMTASVGVSEPVMAPGEDSILSGTSLKNLGSKVVKNLGQICKKSTPHNGSADHGAMSGGMGFGGSMLGEVLVSYSTSTLPPSKRHSISAASAHFEELAAEAGIDLDADEINIEDLRMYRLEEESGYALDDDSDNDDVGENMNDDANAGNQKLAHKERSILQMVDVLSDRLTSLNAVVINRYNGCKSDLDEATDFRSSRTKKMAIAAEDWSSATPRRGADKSKRVTIFHQSSGEGGDGSDAVGPPRMTFRNAPQTDAGRKLAHHFEQEYGMKQVTKFQNHCAARCCALQQRMPFLVLDCRSRVITTPGGFRYKSKTHGIGVQVVNSKENRCYEVYCSECIPAVIFAITASYF